MELVKELVDETRAEGLKLIILWFGMSKNGHPNYVPEYVKMNPGTYRLVIGPDGGTLPALSPHCEETLERDKKAFQKLMEFLKVYDEKERTVWQYRLKMRWAVRERTGTTRRKRRETTGNHFQRH
mgnify:CR=1 FL=1